MVDFTLTHGPRRSREKVNQLRVIQGRQKRERFNIKKIAQENSDFIAKRSTNLSAQAKKDSPDPTARLRKLYLKVLNREPAADELDAGLSYVANFQKKFAARRTETDAWFSLCRILIASNEFVYVD